MNWNLPGAIGIQVCVWGAIAGTRLAVPLLALKQGHGPLVVGILVALFALTQVFLALPAGRFADRHGLRLPVTLAAAVAGAALCAAAALPALPMFCVAALATGAAACVTMIATQRHVGRAARGPVELNRAFSWLAIAPAAGNFVGAAGAGLLIDHAGPVHGDTMNYRYTFLAMAAFALVAWLVVLCMDEARTDPVERESVGTKDEGSRASLMRAPIFRRLLFANWLQGASWDLHNLAVPLLGHERGLSASTIGTIMGLFAVAAALVRIVLPTISKWVGEKQIITTSFLVTAGAMVAYSWCRSALAMGACSVLMGMALGSVQPLVMVLLHRTTPAARHGEALGLRTLFISASSTVLPLLLGAAGAVIGISGLFWIGGAVVALGTGSARKVDLR